MRIIVTLTKALKNLLKPVKDDLLSAQILCLLYKDPDVLLNHVQVIATGLPRCVLSGSGRVFVMKRNCKVCGVAPFFLAVIDPTMKLRLKALITMLTMTDGFSFASLANNYPGYKFHVMPLLFGHIVKRNMNG